MRIDARLALATAMLAAAACSGSGDSNDTTTSPATIVGGTHSDGGADAAEYPPLPPYVPENGPLGADYSIFDHGKECFDRFQVEVPSFDCDGPDSARIKIEVDGSEVTESVPQKCDKPSLAGTTFACVPGARVTKTETLNRYGHTIATVIACRRSALSAIDSGTFDNIAVIQSDLQNGETCWYQIRKPQSFVGRGIPAPYSPGRQKGDAADVKANAVYTSPVTLTSDHTECTRCHDSQVWLRTPWIGTQNQIASSTGKVHEIPRPQGQPTFIGKAYRDWNLTTSRPAQIKIDVAAFDEAFPPSASDATAMKSGSMAPSDACTQCHSIGKSDLATSGQGSCNHFARYWMSEKPSSFASTVLGSKLSSLGNSFPDDAWMPPTAATAFTTESAYRAFYARAFKAIQTCCDDPSRAGCTQ